MRIYTSNVFTMYVSVNVIITYAYSLFDIGCLGEISIFEKPIVIAAAVILVSVVVIAIPLAIYLKRRGCFGNTSQDDGFGE